MHLVHFNPSDRAIRVSVFQMFDFKLPFNLIEECEALNKETTGKRVRNKVIFSNEDFIVMIVIGPNNRSDFHVNSKQVTYSLKS